MLRLQSWLKTNQLALAIALFVLLDMGTLAFGYRISKQVEQDAVAINLAGRQRMLSQRTSKAVLIAATAAPASAQRTEAIAEAVKAYRLFIATLDTFAQGGVATGGNGDPVALAPVRDQARVLVDTTRQLVADWPEVPGDDAAIEHFARFMIAHNLQILDLMNQLTSALEHQSIAAVTKLRWAQFTAFALSLINFVGILWGMHREKLLAERRALSDTLTGLLNRAGIYRTLEATLAAAPSAHTAVGVLLLDLDGFKAVNDTHGHATGDASLCEVSRRLAGWCRPGWHCGRLGGDEFVAICPRLDHTALQAAAAELERLLADVPGGKLIISASVGYALSQPGMSADALVSTADEMMYSRKAARKRSSHFRSMPRDE